MKNAVEMNENQVVEEVKEAETPVETEVKKEKGWKLFRSRKQKAQKESKKDVKAEDETDEAKEPDKSGKGKEIVKKGLTALGIAVAVAGGYVLGKVLNGVEESNSEEDSTMALPPKEAEWTPVEESVPVMEDPATMESPKED